jgi:hypothetical protein
MKWGVATAFLPKFVGFPSNRGLHSATVQLRRAPGATAWASCAPPRRTHGCASGAWRRLRTPSRSPWRGNRRQMLTRRAQAECPPDRLPGGHSAHPGCVLQRPLSPVARCQWPPPHPPPPHDEPPQEWPPPHEWWPPEWWPPDDEPLSLPSAHQLPPPLPRKPPEPRDIARVRPLPLPPERTAAFLKRRPALARSPTTMPPTTTRNIAVTMAPSPFRIPEAAPVGASAFLRDLAGSCVVCLRARGMPRLPTAKAELRNSRAWAQDGGHDLQCAPPPRARARRVRDGGLRRDVGPRRAHRRSPESR